MKNTFFISFMLLCRMANAQAGPPAGEQQEKTKISSPEIGIRPQIGFLMAHHSQMLYLVQGHIRLYEVYAEKVVSGKKDWHHAYRMPAVGCSFTVADMGNNEEMGLALTGLTYVKYRFIRQKTFGLDFRAAGGFAYLSRWFDRTDNNKNSAIAAPYNVCLSLALEPGWKVGRLDLGFIISFTHFSNGAYKMPNLGFNFPAIGVQAGYRFNNHIPQDNKSHTISTFQRRHMLELTALAGQKEVMPANGPKYFAGGLNLLYRWRFHPKSNLLAFGDFSYNAGYRKSYENWYHTTTRTSDGIRLGLGFGYGLSMDRFMLFVHNGFYVYDPLDYDGLLYHRIGGRYNFDNGLVANLSLKTHFAKADVIELGLGYFITLKKQKVITDL